jgi:MFS transporter, putative metabolite:H+ symporter
MPTSWWADGVGSACGFGCIAKIVRLPGLALSANSSNVVKPDATVAAIPTSFLFLAAWLVLCGLSFLVFGFETRERSLAGLDEDDRTGARPTPVAARVECASDGRSRQ